MADKTRYQCDANQAALLHLGWMEERRARLSLESGSRGEDVHPSFFCCGEQREEDELVFGNDPQHQRLAEEDIMEEDLPWYSDDAGDIADDGDDDDYD